jgi:hypothetical protein
MLYHIQKLLGSLPIHSTNALNTIYLVVKLRLLGLGNGLLASLLYNENFTQPNPRSLIWSKRAVVDLRSKHAVVSGFPNYVYSLSFLFLTLPYPANSPLLVWSLDQRAGRSYTKEWLEEAGSMLSSVNTISIGTTRVSHGFLSISF